MFYCNLRKCSRWRDDWSEASYDGMWTKTPSVTIQINALGVYIVVAVLVCYVFLSKWTKIQSVTIKMNALDVYTFAVIRAVILNQ